VSTVTFSATLVPRNDRRPARLAADFIIKSSVITDRGRLVQLVVNHAFLSTGLLSVCSAKYGCASRSIRIHHIAQKRLPVRMM